MIPEWTDRNLWIKNFIPKDSSIIDWGCGTKDILRYITSDHYLGIDILPTADIIVDLDEEIPTITKKYDVGLVLGVLEYLKNYDTFLDKIKDSAHTFIVLSLVDRKQKHNWKNSFTSDTFKILVQSKWKNVSFEINGNYILAICKHT